MAVAPRRASRRRYVLLIIVLTAITLITDSVEQVLAS